MRTKEIEVDVEGTKHRVTLKKLSYGEHNALEEEATQISYSGSQPIVKVSSSKMKELAIFKSIVSSTTPLDSIQKIRDLPKEVGDQLFEAFTELNQQDAKKKD